MVKTNKETEYEKDISELKEQILKEGDTLLTKRDLLERFCEIDKEYNGQPWNLLQILANINILIGEEPCKDTINRQVVLDKIKEVCFSKEKKWVDFRTSYGTHGQRDLIINFIEDLPSVQPKTGHWIDMKYYQSYDDGDIVTTLLMCSHCKEIVRWDTESPHKPYYCENCSAKMIESKENEVTK